MKAIHTRYAVSRMRTIFAVLLFSGQITSVHSQNFDTNLVHHLIDSSKPYFNSDPDKAVTILKEGAALAVNHNFHRGEGLSYKDLGVIYYFIGDFSNSLKFYDKADSVFTVAHDSDQLASIYSNRGVVYILLERYDRAVQDYFRALDINKQKGNKSRLSQNYGNLAAIYFKEKKYAEAWNYYAQALSIDSSRNDSSGIATNLGNMGGILLFQSAFAKAETYFKRCLDIYTALNDQRGLIEVYNHFGVLYEEQNEFELARTNYLKGLQIAESMNAQRFVCSAVGNVANTYLKEEHYAKAVEWAEKEIRLVEEVKDSIQLKGAFRRLAEAYAGLGLYQKGYEIFRKYDSLNELLAKRENERLVNNIRIKHELYDKDKEMRLLLQKNAIQELEIRNVNIRMFGSIIILVLLIVIVFIALKLRNQHLKNNNLTLQHQLFRSQINPHFIFNVFGSIQSYFIDNQYEKGKEYLRNFARLMRLFLERSEVMFSTIEEELGLMRLYLEVEHMRVGGKMTYEIHVDPEIDMQNCLIPSFLAQPYIENAIWHGISASEKKGTVSLTLKKEEDFILLTILDDGIGINASRRMEETAAKKHQSKGMEITLKRISHLNKGRKRKFAVKVIDRMEEQSTETGTRVEIILPVIY